MGGPFTSEWSDEALPIQWDAPYNPMLPADLADVAAVDWSAAEAY